MSITIKVHGGTLGSVNKCQTCEHAQYMVDDSNRPIVYCSQIQEYIRRKIVSCSEHTPKGETMASRAMRNIAWSIRRIGDGQVRVEIPDGDETIYQDGKPIWRNGSRIKEPRKRAAKAKGAA